MSTKGMERVISLLMAVLMITTAFIPAVSAAESNATTLNMDTAGDSFPDKTSSGLDTHKAAFNTVQSQENPSLWSEKNWSQPTSWTNTSISTSAEIRDTGGSGTDASLASNATYVVTDSGKIRLKTYEPETRTICITDESRSAADADLEIRLVNATPDLGTFTEIFEITAHRTMILDGSEDFLATWSLQNGNENITRAEWFVWEERSHSIEIPIIEYRDIIPGNVVSENVAYEDVIPETVALENVPFEDEVPINATPEPLPPEEALPADTALETFVAQEPYIAGTETVERSWPEWVPFTPDGQTLNAGKTRLFKVIYTKPAETGRVDINTAPIFRGVACPELTWWSTAWATRVPVTITTPPSVDGYPHREVVLFRSGMQSDFDDVRFVADDGTVLGYWKETYTASDSAVIWVNLPAGATSIWMYYGNEAVIDTGNRDNAYILYDDFDGPDLDTTLWTDTIPGAHYFVDGWIYDTRAQGAGALVSNEPVITDGEPVIVEMHIHADSLPSNAGYSCGAFPWFVDTPTNGLLWYPESPSWDRYVYMNGAAAWRPGTARGLSAGGDYSSTWIITPTSQTHTVSGSASYTDVFTGATGISSHQMQILGGNNAPEGRVVRMDWIRVRKYVETEPAFTYGAPQTVPVVKTVAVTPSIVEVVEGETIQFTATAYDQYGAAMEDIAFNWVSTNEMVGTVTSDGIFSARAAGTTTISAVTSTGGSVWGIAKVTVIHTVTPGSAWNWSTDGWTGWAHTASWTQPTGSCSEYGPVMVGSHGEHGADVHLSAGAVIGTVEHEFTDPSGVGWDSLTLVARVPGTDIPQGRWMTIEVNDEVVYAESGFSGSDPENFLPKEFHADFPQSGTVRVKVSHGQNPAWGTHFSMEYYSLELHPPSSAAPSITLTSPIDDAVGAGGTVTVAGNVSDPAITSLTLTHNGVSSTIPIKDGNFSAEVTLADANTIVVSGVDSQGAPLSATLLLDGDMLPAAFEQAIGFDPLNADSDCSQWTGNQSGNGVIDGYEVFAGDLPVFAKARIGADPFVVDTDADGLTDSFELLKLGTFPEEPGMLSAMGGPIVAAGTDDDPDGDGLSNLEEQTYGTDPLVADTDKDGLSDADEILRGTDPRAADTDGDGLADGAEVALGTDPTIPDSNDNEVPDGAEDYWSGDRFLDDTLDLTVFGRGYAVANVSVAAVNYTHLISDEILVSKVCNIGFGDDVETGTVAIAYDPTHVVDPSRLSIYRFDEDLGTFVNVTSTVDAVNGVVSCAAAGSAKYAVLDSARWDALFADDESIESLGETDIYHASLWVRDSQTGEGVGEASVTFWSVMGSQDLTTTTHATGDRKGLTRNFAEYPTSGTKAYSIEKDGYKDHNGMFRIEPDVFSYTATSRIHRVDAPTGFLTVTSTPTGAIVYIDNIYYGSGVSNVELLEGEHTLVLTTPSAYYGTAIETVEITRNQNTQIHVNLPPTFSCGDLRVICPEPGAAVSIDGFSVGTIPVSGEFTKTDVASGTREIAVTKEGFVPYSEYVTVVAGQTSTVNAVLVPEDLDGDGLPDIYENGYRDGFGNWHAPDPYAVDTDGDGLSDGYEAGELVTEGGKTYYKQRSDPTKADTDGDGLDDYLEDAIESDPLNPDSDGDGLSDALEWEIGTDLWSADTDEDGHSDYEEWYDPDYDPLVYEERFSSLTMGREFLLGAVLGEWGADDHDNIYYLGGWVASGVIVIGDLRDIAATISRGDLVGTGLNLAALIPGYGDAAKVAAVVGKFVLKHPELLKPAMVLLVGVAPHVDEAAEWASNFRKIHGDEAVNKFLKDGITESDLNVIAKNRGDLSKTLEVTKRADGKVVWLEEGLTEAEAVALGVRPSGWKHIKEKHILDPRGNQFVKFFGQEFGTDSAVKELIMEGAKYGQKVNEDGLFEYVEPNSGKILHLVIGDNGYIVSAFPFGAK